MRFIAAVFCALLTLSIGNLPRAEAAVQKNVKTAQSAKAAKAKPVAGVKKTKAAKKNTTKTAKSPAQSNVKGKTAGRAKTVKSAATTKAVATKVSASKTSAKKTSASSRKFAASKHYQSRKNYTRRYVRGPSYAQLMGLRGSSDPLSLATTAVLAYDLESDQILYEKNAEKALPIASITKLMTALVIVESGVDLNERFTVTKADFVRSSARSKLRNGMKISRKEALHLALMSSDNRAAHFLARTYPGGEAKFIADMNTKAALLSMEDSVFYDSIGLNNGNKCTAIDLSHLIAAASEYDLIRNLSTTPEASFQIGKRSLVSRTTNSFVNRDNWDIDLQKTGLTTAAGYCMVMQANIAGRPIAMIFLDAPNKTARNQDIEKLHSYLSSGKPIETASR